MLLILGFLPATDRRMRATIGAIAGDATCGNRHVGGRLAPNRRTGARGRQERQGKAWPRPRDREVEMSPHPLAASGARRGRTVILAGARPPGKRTDRGPAGIRTERML